MLPEIRAAQRVFYIPGKREVKTCRDELFGQTKRAQKRSDVLDDFSWHPFSRPVQMPGWGLSDIESHVVMPCQRDIVEREGKLRER